MDNYHVIKCKLDKKYLKTHKNLQHILNQSFEETKWIYNYFINEINKNNKSPFELNWGKTPNMGTQYADTFIPVYNIKLNKFVNKQLYYIMNISHARFRLLKRLQTSFKSNVSNVKNGNYTHFKLKYKSFINTITLPSDCFFIKRNNNYISFRKLEHLQFKLNGFNKQISKYKIKNYKIQELSLKRIYNKNSKEYYIYFYIRKDNLHNISKIKIDKEFIGIDFNIYNTITLSNGEIFKFDYQNHSLEIKIRKLISIKDKFKSKNSKNFHKIQMKIKKLKIKLKQIKLNDCYKLLNYLISKYNLIMQDENIESWKINVSHSSNQVIQHSIIGLLNSLLRNHSIIINKYLPTTKKCSNCGNIKETIDKTERTYYCEKCKIILDRDINSAKNILNYGLKIYNN